MKLMKLPKEMTFRFLIIGSKNKGYIGMCKETGVIRGGQSVEILEKQLINSTVAIINTVMKDEKYLPSLYSGLPFKFTLQFYYYLLRILFRRFVSGFEISFFTRNTSNLVSSYV